jgi:hypothetical protein
VIVASNISFLDGELRRAERSKKKAPLEIVEGAFLLALFERKVK